MLNAGQQSTVTEEVLRGYVTSGSHVTEDIGGNLGGQNILLNAGQQSTITEEILGGHVPGGGDVTGDINCQGRDVSISYYASASDSIYIHSRE